LCEKQGCIVVYPTGLYDNDRGYSGWNATGSSTGYGSEGYTCNLETTTENAAACPYSCACDNVCIWGSCADDRKFTSDLLDWVESNFCIDLDRVYLTGMSNGAMFNYDLGQSSLIRRFAAMAPVSGSPHWGFNNGLGLGKYYLSVMHIHGTRDITIPANASKKDENRTTDGQGMWYYTPVDDVLEIYGEENGCTDFLNQPITFDVPVPVDESL